MELEVELEELVEIFQRKQKLRAFLMRETKK